MHLREKLLNNNFSDLLFQREHKNYIHPSQIAQLLETVPTTTALKAFDTYDNDIKPLIFRHLKLHLQKTILKHLPDHQKELILNQMNGSDRIIFLSSLKQTDQTKHTNLLNEEYKKIAHHLLGYPKNSVARIMNTNMVTVHKHETIAEASARIRQAHSNSPTANVVYVVTDTNELLDDLPIRSFVFSNPNQTIEELLDYFCPTLSMTELQTSAVLKFKQYDRTVLPVVNNHNLLVGIVTINDILDVEEQQTTKAIQQIGGLEGLDYPYVKTPLISLIKKRASWLIILFLSEMLTATAMGYFNNEIAKAVVLALFVPLIISSGGNSGSQAATLIIRAMALKELTLKDWWRVMRRELVSGLSLGLILGVIGFIRIAIWQQFNWFNYGTHWALIALTIFFSLIGIVLWGTLSGSMAPMLLKKLGLDPATSSAPFVATLVDVTGLVIYFSIAAIILKGTLL